MSNGGYTQGSEVLADQDRGLFLDAIHAAVDYRGDVTLTLKDGREIVGYLFNCTDQTLDLYPKDEDRKQELSIDIVGKLAFSGRDTAA